MKTIEELREEKKEYIMSYRNLKNLIRIEEDRLRQFRIDKSIPSAIRYTGMPSGSGGSSDLSNYEVREEELIESVERAKENYYRKLREIHDAVHAISNKEYVEILELRYLGKKTSWKKIADKMSYSESRIYELRNKALDAFEIPENTV